MNMDARNSTRDVELWLDATLGRYNKVEPRTGLENRVLAKLHAERMTSQRQWWWTAVAIALVATIIVAVWLGSVRMLPVRTLKTTAGTNPKNALVSENLISTPQVSRIPKKTRSVKRASRDVSLDTPPKLKLFPSPAPL